MCICLDNLAEVLWLRPQTRNPEICSSWVCNPWVLINTGEAQGKRITSSNGNGIMWGLQGFAYKGLAVGSGGFFKSAIRCQVAQGLNGHQHHVGYV